MVRLLVRKSLLSAWTSSRLYGRQRAARGGAGGGVGQGRHVHRRGVASAAGAVAAGHDDGDIRLDVLCFSCCCDDGDSCCCCCCMTDEECQGKLPVTSVPLLFYCVHYGGQHLLIVDGCNERVDKTQEKTHQHQAWHALFNLKYLYNNETEECLNM